METSKHDNAAEFRTESDDVFGRIANRYDLLCDLFSLFAHRHWKNQLATDIVKTKGSYFVDIASGTGHIVHRVIARLQSDESLQRKSIYATDISPGMLAVARRKDKFGYQDVSYAVESAYDMTTIGSASVDVLSFSFAMKITDRASVMREVARVLKPGGVFYCLDAARIAIGPLHRFYLLYMDICVPLMAAIATGGDASAYNYLLKGIYNMPKQDELADEISSYGFDRVTYRNLSFGIVAIHRAVKT